ncbi:hypothetical protein ACWD69_09245 [Micromonospora chokoriensis]
MNMNNHELVWYLRRCYEADNHAYADIAQRFGEYALMDSHLPLLDMVNKLARDWQVMDPADERYTGITYSLRTLVQAYLHLPGDH